MILRRDFFFSECLVAIFFLHLRHFQHYFGLSVVRVKNNAENVNKNSRQNTRTEEITTKVFVAQSNQPRGTYIVNIVYS